MLSASATFAADADDAIAVVDETAVDETLAVEETPTVSADDAPEGVVTNDTFYNYFDDSGALKANVTSTELTFKGEIDNVGVDTIVLDRPIKITGDNSTVTNIGFFINSSDVTLSGLTINQNAGEAGIAISNASNVEISDMTVNFNANPFANGYAINADLADNLKLINNAISYVGATTGWEINNGIRVSNSADSKIKGNKFNLILVSAAVGWAEVPSGSGNWVQSAISEGIVIDSSNGVEFENNTVEVNYNDVCGAYDTIYAIDFKNSSGADICSNNIVANGHTYIYAIQMSGEDFYIYNNTINSVTDNYYACGIDIEGPASGVVDSNEINAKGVVSAYPIYSGMNGKDVTAGYIHNAINGEAYFVLGMSIGDAVSDISDNFIDISGNYTTGIAYRGSNLTVLGNHILLTSSEEGNESVWEDFGVETVGIKVIQGNATIEDNYIKGQGKGISVVGESVVADIEENMIVFDANNDKDAYAVYASNIANLTLSENRIDYHGTTNGSAVNNAVYINNVTGAQISENEFYLYLISSYVPWAEVPAGSGNWVSSPISEGIVVADSTGVVFDGNNVTVNYMDVVGEYDTIYSISFKNSDNATITNNKIEANGHTYTYGLQVSGENFKVANNEITSVSDNYYACGIDIEGPASGVVAENAIDVKANTSAYAIYSGMNGAEVNTEYINNTITADAYNVFAFSLGDAESNVTNNFIDISGNYTTGIAYRGSNLSVKGNHMVLISSEEGTEYIWEEFGVETVGIKVVQGNADISDNVIATAGKGISIDGDSTTANLTGNFINVVANNDKDAYVVYALNTANLTLYGNEIDYQGATNGTGINYAIYLNNATGAIVSNNDFDLDLVSSYVPWLEIPTGSGNWVKFPVSEGIVVEDSSDVVFDGNNVSVEYGDVSGDYDTIYSLDFKNSDNAIITNNVIVAEGHSFVYGILISSTNFTIRANNLSVVSDNYYANGINPDNGASGVVEDNVIAAIGVDSSYPIYSYMYGSADLNVDYIHNQIYGSAYYTVGLEIGGAQENVINNTIVADGNFTIGIRSNSQNNTISGNIIRSVGSNVGNNSYLETTAVVVSKANAVISDNYIDALNGDYAIDLKGTKSTVENNYVASKKSVGDNSIVGARDAVIVNATPALKTVLSANDVCDFYGQADVYYVVAKDENGDPIANVTIFASVNGKVYNETTDSKGVAPIFLDLGAGEYTIESFFNGNDVYGPKSITGKFTVEPRPVDLIAPETVTVLLTDIKKGSYVTLNLKDYLGNNVGNQVVEITFNGVTSNYTTDDMGVIKYKLSATKTGTQKLTAVFSSNSNYTAVSIVSTVKINKEATKLTAAKKTYKAKTKVKKYAVTLKDSKGKAISKVKVTLKVKGKTYKATTNSKGKVIFKIKKLTKKGNYIAKVKFAGNAYYNASTKSVKITVK